jgi:hypothetical protein
LSTLYFFKWVLSTSLRPQAHAPVSIRFLLTLRSPLFYLHRLPSAMPPSRRRRTEAGYLRVPHRRVAPSPSPKNGSESLRRYLETACLPSISRHDRSHPYFLPRRGRRSHKNRLRVRKDPERHIKQIRKHDSKAFNKAAKLCP